jgi:hypothetical protein
MEDLSVSYWRAAFAVVYAYYFDDMFLVFEAMMTKATHCHYRLQWRTNCCFDGTTAMMVMNPYLLLCLLALGNRCRSYALYYGLPRIDKIKETLLCHLWLRQGLGYDPAMIYLGTSRST